MTYRLPVPMPILGLSVGKPGEFIDQRATPSCQNVDFSRFTITKRIGEGAIGTTASQRILALGELVRGASRYHFRIGTTKFEEYTSGAWTSRANTALTGTATETICYTFPLLSAAKILVYTNGLDNIRKWTGSGNDADLGGTPPKAKYVLAVGPYLVLAYVIDGGNTYHSRVQWCDTGLIETWTGGNSGSTNLIDDIQAITGAALYSDGMTIHKENCIYVGYKVTTSEVFRFDRRNTGVGAAANGTIQNLPSGEQIFLAKDGIHVFNGTTAPLIESDIMDEIREQANPAYLYKATSKIVAEKDEYWVAVAMGSQTEPETVYKYNYKTGQAYKDVRTGLTCFGEYQATDQRTWNDIGNSWDSEPSRWDDVLNLTLAPTITFGHSTGVVTKRQATYDDNGTAIDAFWDSKDFTATDLGIADHSMLIRWQGVEVFAKGSSVTVQYSTDGGTNWISPSTSTISLSGDYPSDSSPINVWFDTVSTRIRFRFKNNTSGSNFTLKQFIPIGVQRENRR